MFHFIIFFIKFISKKFFKKKFSNSLLEFLLPIFPLIAKNIKISEISGKEKFGPVNINYSLKNCIFEDFKISSIKTIQSDFERNFIANEVYAVVFSDWTYSPELIPISDYGQMRSKMNMWFNITLKYSETSYPPKYKSSEFNCNITSLSVDILGSSTKTEIYNFFLSIANNFLKNEIEKSMRDQLPPSIENVTNSLFSYGTILLILIILILLILCNCFFCPCLCCLFIITFPFGIIGIITVYILLIIVLIYTVYTLF